MPRVKDQPENLRPYIAHGVLLTVDGDEAVGECPFCSREKFSVNVEKGTARCWGCPVLLEETEKGGINHASFLKILWKLSDERKIDYTDLAHERNLPPETLMQWGVVPSLITDEWLIPGYNAKGEICQLYRYVTIKGRKRLLATPQMKHGLHGVNLYSKRKSNTMLCEGPWDAMALWTTLGVSQMDDEGEITPTMNRKENMLATVNVLAVPGCEVFSPSWASLFSGTSLVLMYDNDHPKKVKGKKKPATTPSMAGMEKVSGILGTSREPPDEIGMVYWSDEDQLYNAHLSDGYDVRDKLELERVFGG